jgi:hypothetical protein
MPWSIAAGLVNAIVIAQRGQQAHQRTQSEQHRAMMGEMALYRAIGASELSRLRLTVAATPSGPEEIKPFDSPPRKRKSIPKT